MNGKELIIKERQGNGKWEWMVRNVMKDKTVTMRDRKMEVFRLSQRCS